MAPSKSENYQEQNEFSETSRERKVKKRRYPRGRGFALREKRKLTIERSQEIEAGIVKEKIAKQISNFSDLDRKEGKSQAEKYIGWVARSLSLNYPDISEGDIEYKSAVASVKAGGQKRQKTRSSVRATHLPTLISVRNEEERSLEQNKSAAYENLYKRLTEHLSFWQTLLRNSPETYSLSEIERRGVDLLKELRWKS